LARERPDATPWEFRHLGYKPAKWTAEDVVRIRSHGLTRNLLSEVARANTLCKAKNVDVDQVRFGLSNDWKAQVPEGLDPCLPADVLKTFTLATQGVRVTKDAMKVSAAPALLAEVEAEAASEGSNSWVVAPSKSATGRPIMANDPHRAYSAPSLRYIAHLSAPGIDVVGAGEPALPGISLGHNGTIAFGLTIFNMDQEDLYVYELDADARRYKYKDGFEEFRVMRESVAVKGAAPKEVELVFTRHGPVIHVDKDKRRAYAVRSGWLEPGMSPYFGSLDYMRAKDFATFRAALVNWGAPTENQVYADVKGNIGWSRRVSRPSAPTGTGCCRCRATGASNGAGSGAATTCRGRTTRRRDSSPPPTPTTSPRTIRRASASWASNGPTRRAINARTRCWGRCARSRSRIRSACRTTSCRFPRGGSWRFSLRSPPTMRRRSARSRCCAIGMPAWRPTRRRPRSRRCGTCVTCARPTATRCCRRKRPRRSPRPTWT
jgi:hypothetical protein